MRKMMLLAAMVAIAALMLAAAPTFADDNDNHDGNDNFCDFFDCHDNNNFRFDDNNRNFFVPEISQENEQEAESGDVNQSFNVTGGGDNSNQCVGVQGTANTGNAQNQIGVTEIGDGFDNFNHNNDFFHNNFFHNDGFNDFNNHRFDGNGGDFEFNDVGSSIEMNPVNTTSCDDQQVNQAATASG